MTHVNRPGLPLMMASLAVVATLGGCSDLLTGNASGNGGTGTGGSAGSSHPGAAGVAGSAGLGGSPSYAGAATTPTVLEYAPKLGATEVPLNESVRVTFSEEMDRSTVTPGTFRLTSGTPPILVPGTVTYSHTVAVFWPAALLASTTTYTASITTGARSAAGAPIAAEYPWTFATGTTAAPDTPVNLGTAVGFAVLTKSGISGMATSSITGDIGVSPAAATYITGFALTADSTNVFSTSPQLVGRAYAADYAVPTPSNLTTAVGDMELAYTEASGRAPKATEVGAGNVGGMTLTAGVYKWGTGLLIPTDVTLSGSPTEVWIFQIGQGLTMSSGARVIMTGGALPKNVFWQIAGLAEFGTTSHCEGVILTQTAAILHTGASINGRLLAQTSVSIDAGTVIQPVP